MKYMKAMISQPMAGKSQEDILKTKAKAVKALEAMGYEVVNTLFTDEWYSPEKMDERALTAFALVFNMSS